MLSLLRDFWTALREERVDVNNLIMISSRLFPIKQQIETAWKKHLTEESFASWNILRTYSYYCRKILHDSMRASIIEDYCNIL